MLDSETGEEPAWSPLVRYLGFPSGRIKPTSVCWSLHRAKPSEWPQDATSSTSTSMKDTQPPLMIMAAVDGEVIGLRLDLFKVDSLPLDCPPGPISSRETFRIEPVPTQCHSDTPMSRLGQAAVEEDGNFSVPQLAQLSDEAPWMVTHIVRALGNMVHSARDRRDQKAGSKAPVHSKGNSMRM